MRGGHRFGGRWFLGCQQIKVLESSRTATPLVASTWDSSFLLSVESLSLELTPEASENKFTARPPFFLNRFELWRAFFLKKMTSLSV